MTVGKSKKLLALLTAMLMMASLVVGCSSGEEAEEGGTSEVTVKLGIGAPLTQGAVALGKGMERGTNLAIDDFNAGKGKELGIVVEPFTVDDQGDPKVGVNVANQLASDPNVIGVMGHLNSGVSIPGSDVYGKAGIVQISPASTNPALTLSQKYGNVFRVCTIDPVQGSYAAEKAFGDLGFKTAFVIDDSTPYGEGLASEFAKAFEAAGGTIVGTEKTTDKDTDFNALVTKMKSLNPQVIYYAGIYNAGALLAKQAKEAGLAAPYFSGDGSYDQAFVDLAGAANAEGSFATSVGLPLDQQPQGEDFKAKFEAKYAGEEIAAYDTYSYDAALVILEATAKVAEEMGADKLTTAEGKAAIIEAVAATSIEGITGAIAFDENGDTTNKAITLYVVKDGAWTAWAK